MKFNKNKKPKVKYTKLPDNQYNTPVQPIKKGFHIFWWWKGYEEPYIKYEIHFKGDYCDENIITETENPCESKLKFLVDKYIEECY